MIATYEKNTADVQATIPPERLLTYQTGDGWDPICRFLGIPVPEEAYPHKNQGGEFHQKIDVLNQKREDSQT